MRPSIGGRRGRRAIGIPTDRDFFDVRKSGHGLELDELPRAGRYVVESPLSPSSFSSQQLTLLLDDRARGERTLNDALNLLEPGEGYIVVLSVRASAPAR